MKIFFLILFTLFNFSFSAINSSNNTVSASINSIISVKGNATISIEPNIVYFSIGASFISNSTKTAMRNVSSTIENLIKMAKLSGIKKKDIQTSRISLTKTYKWVKGSNKFIGYKANSNIILNIMNIKTIESTIASLIEVPKIEIQYFNYSHTKYDSLKQEVSLLALKNAKQLAKKICKQENLKLGKLYSFSNHSKTPRSPIYTERKLEKASFSSRNNSSNFKMNIGKIDIYSSIIAEYLSK